LDNSTALTVAGIIERLSRSESNDVQWGIVPDGHGYTSESFFEYVRSRPEVAVIHFLGSAFHRDNMRCATCIPRSAIRLTLCVLALTFNRSNTFLPSNSLISLFMVSARLVKFYL